MNSHSLCFSPQRLALLCLFAAVCCAAIGCSASNDSARGSSGSGYNLFDRSKKNSNNAPKIQHTVRGDQLERVSQILNKAFDPEQKQTRQTILYFAIRFSILAVVIAALIYWRLWSQGRIERQRKNPMALVQELNFVHQLTDPEKRFMQELSKRNILPNPLTLFVEPKFLLEAWENDAYYSSRHTIHSLLNKLFETTPPSRENSTIIGNRSDVETVIFPQGTQVS